MTIFKNLTGSPASLTEMRLDAAMKMAALRLEIENYQELSKSASESNVSQAEMRLTSAIKITALRIEINKYQELGVILKPATYPGNVEELTPPVPPTNITTAQNELPYVASSFSARAPLTTNINESDWVNKQARMLLGERKIKKIFTLK